MGAKRVVKRQIKRKGEFERVLKRAVRAVMVVRVEGTIVWILIWLSEPARCHRQKAGQCG